MVRGSRPASAQPGCPRTVTWSTCCRPTRCACAGSPAPSIESIGFPPDGADPLTWLDAALDVYRSGRFDVLFPTQEQVAVLSWAKSRLGKAGVATAVPSFAALVAVQDKISASATLRRLGIPQPPSAVGVDGWARFPAFVKDPIGTASGGVRRVATPGNCRARRPENRYWSKQRSTAP